MRKLFKLLFKQWYIPLFVIILLSVQAFSELSIPEYTSNIVNVGIQQKGVESYIAKQIRIEEFEKLLLFMTEDEKTFIQSFYTDGISDNGFRIYKLTDSISGFESELEEIMGLPLVMLFAMNNMDSNSDISMDFGEFTGEVLDFSNPETMGIILEQLKELDSSIVAQIATQQIISEYEILGIDQESNQISYMMDIGFIMIAYAFLAITCEIFTSLFMSRFAGSFARRTRNAVFSKIMRFSNYEFDKFSTASLITRSTNDIQQIQMMTGMGIRMMFYAPIMGLGAFYKVMNTGSSIGWVIGVAIGALTLLVISLFTVALPKFQVLQKLIDRVNLVSREILTGLPVIRAFSKEVHEMKRFGTANTNLMKVNLFISRSMAIMFPTMMFIMNAISVLILWVGSAAVDTGGMQVGDLMAFITYTMQIIMSFLFLSMLSIILPRSIISFRRVAEILETEISIKDPENPKKFNDSKKGFIEFKNVCFRYKNAEDDVLKNINITIKPGQTTAVIGSTGSGKSTLANLIPRFFDVTDGEIIVDGLNIRDVTLKDLRDKIGYIPQKATLFSGTIKSNITYSAVDYEMNPEQMELAAKISQAEEFIGEREDGYDSNISQGGANVSGGQKQRLSIARAVAKNPEIYIFDDSFSALDYKTDVSLRKELSKTTQNSTVIIIAQRISTIMNAEQIIVLDEGEVVGTGTHKELLASCEVYRDIASSQLSKEELARKEGE